MPSAQATGRRTVYVMTLPVVSVVAGTVKGREDHFRRFVESYTACAEGSYELDLVVEHDRPTCGWAWQCGVERIRPDSQFQHFSCDDITCEPGWADAAIEALSRHVLPAPRVLNGQTGAPEFFPLWGHEWAEGTLAGFSALPFVSRELLDQHVLPLFTAHYDSDTWFTYRVMRTTDYFPRVTRGYAFRHHWASHLRGAGMEYEARLKADRELLGEAIRMVEDGEWTQPWPPMEPGMTR